MVCPKCTSRLSRWIQLQWPGVSCVYELFGCEVKWLWGRGLGDPGPRFEDADSGVLLDVDSSVSLALDEE